MSGTPANPHPAGSAGDPSMEDILASIRRILSEDDAVPPEPPAAEPPAAKDDVLTLDASMLVAPPMPALAAPAHAPPPESVATPPPRPSAPPPAAPAATLLAPETEAAVASSVGGLLRTLIAEREQVPVYRGGPTIEDLVREEIRPLLKQWLDTNLQALVERHVRAEIERVVGRAVS
jgi:cell pole-organizing protein PopZ